MIGANSERECCGWLSEREFGLCGGPSPYMPEPRRFRLSRNHRSGMLHKQSFDLLEPEAVSPARWSTSTLGVLLLHRSPLRMLPPQRGYIQPGSE